MHVFSLRQIFVQPRRRCATEAFRRGDWIETELTDPSVDARRGSGEKVSSDVRELTDLGIDVRHGIR